MAEGNIQYNGKWDEQYHFTHNYERLNYSVFSNTRISDLV